LLIDAARPVRHLAGDRWFVDETYVKISGVWSYVYRTVDQQGQVIDVYVSQRRDIASARTFFTVALAVHADPAAVIPDRAPALANVVEELPDEPSWCRRRWCGSTQAMRPPREPRKRDVSTVSANGAAKVGGEWRRLADLDCASDAMKTSDAVSLSSWGSGGLCPRRGEGGRLVVVLSGGEAVVEAAE
jgi:transposase-like protein